MTIRYGYNLLSLGLMTDPRERENRGRGEKRKGRREKRQEQRGERVERERKITNTEVE